MPRDLFLGDCRKYGDLIPTRQCTHCGAICDRDEHEGNACGDHRLEHKYLVVSLYSPGSDVTLVEVGASHVSRDIMAHLADIGHVPCKYDAFSYKNTVGAWISFKSRWYALDWILLMLRLGIDPNDLPRDVQDQLKHDQDTKDAIEAVTVIAKIADEDLGDQPVSGNGPGVRAFSAIMKSDFGRRKNPVLDLVTDLTRKDIIELVRE